MLAGVHLEAQEGSGMSFLEDLHKVKRSKEFQEKELEQLKKITHLRREQKFKDLEPMVRDMLDAMGMATWGSTDGQRNYEILSDIAGFRWKLFSGPYEYVLKLIFDEEGQDYFEVGVMGNMARSLSTAKPELSQILKTIYKRGPDYTGIQTRDNRKKPKK
jgi:hypothetical protein